MDEADDADLMQRWQRGDARAFEILVRRWQGRLAGFYRRLLGRSAPIADLCQEAMLRLYQAGPRYRESGAFAPWLYRIALNVARDTGRRGPRLMQPLLDDDVPDPAPAADRRCERRECDDAVSRAIDDLPEPLRLALVLRHYEGLSFEEMARLSGTPASTLKSRFTTALGRLRQHLCEQGFGPEEAAS